MVIFNEEARKERNLMTKHHIFMCILILLIIKEPYKEV
jgi:hypothetical protein